MRKGPLVYLILFILSLVAITLYGGAMSYAFFFGITLVFVMSFLYMMAVVICFRIYQKTEGRTMVVDEEIGYYFVIDNAFPFSFCGIKVELYSDYFTVADSLKSEPYVILPFEKVSYNTKISCKYRGEYPIGVKSVVIYDFLNLFRIRYKLRSSLNAIVNPKIIRLNELKSLKGEFSTNTEGMLNGNENLDSSVRDYEKGDSIRKIHWKATAKTGELKVRNMYDEKKQGICIFFDNKRISDDMSVYLPYENKVLEIVLALTSYFACENTEVNIMSEKPSSVVNVNGMQQFESFYSKVCECIFDKGVKSEEMENGYIEFCISEMPKLAYFIVSDISDNLIIKTQRLIDLSIKTVIYVVSENWNEKYRHYHSENRQIVVIDPEADLSEVL